MKRSNDRQNNHRTRPAPGDAWRLLVEVERRGHMTARQIEKSLKLTPQATGRLIGLMRTHALLSKQEQRLVVATVRWDEHGASARHGHQNERLVLGAAGTRALKKKRAPTQ